MNFNRDFNSFLGADFTFKYLMNFNWDYNSFQSADFTLKSLMNLNRDFNSFLTTETGFLLCAAIYLVYITKES